MIYFLRVNDNVFLNNNREGNDIDNSGDNNINVHNNNNSFSPICNNKNDWVIKGEQNYFPWLNK